MNTGMQGYPTEIKWIVAQRVRGASEWKVRFLGSGNCPNLDHVLDVTPICQVETSEFATFRNRLNWADYKPRYYYRGFALEDVNIDAALGGLINELESDWF